MRPGVFKTFIKNPLNIYYQGSDADERIELVIRKSLYSLVFKFFMILFLFCIPLFLIPPLAKVVIYNIHVFNAPSIFVLTLFFYLFAAGFTFVTFITWFFEVFLVTNKKIVDINESCRSISETPITNVQDVTSKISGNIGEILNIGRIYIQTASETPEFGINMVDNPSFVRDTISDLVTKEKKHGHL